MGIVSFCCLGVERPLWEWESLVRFQAKREGQSSKWLGRMFDRRDILVRVKVGLANGTRLVGYVIHANRVQVQVLSLVERVAEWLMAGTSNVLILKGIGGSNPSCLGEAICWNW